MFLSFVEFDKQSLSSFSSSAFLFRRYLVNSSTLSKFYTPILVCSLIIISLNAFYRASIILVLYTQGYAFSVLFYIIQTEFWSFLYLFANVLLFAISEFYYLYSSSFLLASVTNSSPAPTTDRLKTLPLSLSIYTFTPGKFPKSYNLSSRYSSGSVASFKSCFWTLSTISRLAGESTLGKFTLVDSVKVILDYNMLLVSVKPNKEHQIIILQNMVKFSA